MPLKPPGRLLREAQTCDWSGSGVHWKPTIRTWKSRVLRRAGTSTLLKSTNLGVASTPMSRHCCCMFTSEFSRTLLPALVIISNLSFRPALLARIPSGPFFQPAASSIDSAFLRSKLKTGLLFGL